MSEAKFTPGPWRDPGDHEMTRYGDINHVIIGADERVVGSIYANCFDAPNMRMLPTVEQAEANARLIASAPDLLEALKLARKRIEYLGSFGADRHQMSNIEDYFPPIDAALSKATGE